MSTKYTYSILNDFLNSKVATDKLDIEIKVSTITIALDYINTDSDYCDIWFKSSLGGSDQTTLSGIVSSHDGVAETIVDQVTLSDELRDTTGKLRIHQSSRKTGTKTYFTSAGDDPTDVTDVGGGTEFCFHHATGSGLSQTLYIDLNCIENETWIHEGYIMWKGCDHDHINFEIIPRTVNYTTSSGTYYNIYGGYLVIPAAGDGTANITSDLTAHDGGLVYMTDDEQGNTPAAYWNADWNTTTKEFENITAAPTGNGRYNMFTVPVTLAKFANKICLLGDGFVMMQSSDTDQIGHGMRFKISTTTNTLYGGDRDWEASCIVTMHRDKTV